jgi:hypothetical protein
MYELRGGPLHKGDKLLICTEIGTNGQWADRNDIVEVDFLLADYGKIIAKHVGGKNARWPTLCLYYSQEDFVWGRLGACPECKRSDYLDWHTETVSCDNCQMNFPLDNLLQRPPKPV